MHSAPIVSSGSLTELVSPSSAVHDLNVSGGPVNTSLPPMLARSQQASRLRGSFTPADLKAFKDICSQKIVPSDYPLAESFSGNVPIYSGSVLRHSCNALTRDTAMAELHQCLLHGPGVFVIRAAFPDHAIIDRAERAYAEIIESEKGTSGKGDHFAVAGANDRIWNSFQKFAMIDPEGFIEYYANEVLSLVCEAWLGPGYAITTQTNIVKPGGQAQEPHRDYHLGFQAENIAARFPIVSQIASQLLTLQGAIAHTDLSVASGSTQLLPFSQNFDNGYAAYRHEEFAEVFHQSMVQLDCYKGDAVFFNPALFHAAGANVTENFRRSVNLLQVSACWGKPMESVDRKAVLERIWPSMQILAPKLGPARMDALLQAVCDAYSFPTNLDLDPPPTGGHCPETQLDVVRAGVANGWSKEILANSLSSLERKRLA